MSLVFTHPIVIQDAQLDLEPVGQGGWFVDDDASVANGGLITCIDCNIAP
jgi:hypothetical protein